LNQPAGPRVAVAFTLLLPLGAITGLALGSVLRRPVTAVLAVVAVLALLPGLAGPAARHLTMYGAWSILANQPDPGAPTSIGMAWLVFCGWPIIALTLAVAQRRDIP
jgi:ABC-2 type transport system permease protein